ncbi:MAG: hypothetical protein QMD00_01130 [Hadesarchaea archaeon]|nr:hypothetical protein [Hadesarchaea archaeon]
MNKVIFSLIFLGALMLTLVSAVYQADVTTATDVQDIGYGLPLPWITASRGFLKVVSPWHFYLNPLGLLVNMLFYAMVITVLFSLRVQHRRGIWTFNDHYKLHVFVFIGALITISWLLVLFSVIIMGAMLNIDTIFRSSVVVCTFILSLVVLKRSRKYAEKMSV